MREDLEDLLIGGPVIAITRVGEDVECARLGNEPGALFIYRSNLSQKGVPFP